MAKGMYSICPDIERFILLYKSVGVELTSKENKDGSLYIELRQGAHPKFGGNYDFFSEIVFDKDGKFVEQNFWE